RDGDYPPIKFPEGLSTSLFPSLKLRTERGSDWTFEKIKKIDDVIYESTVKCEKMFGKIALMDIHADKDTSEVLSMIIKNFDAVDMFIWDESKEGYVRFFYNG